MNMFLFFLFGYLALFMCGCSTTPGDAALRGGHPTHAADLYKQGALQGDSSAALKLGLLIDNGTIPTTQLMIN